MVHAYFHVNLLIKKVHLQLFHFLISSFNMVLTQKITDKYVHCGIVKKTERKGFKYVIR